MPYCTHCGNAVGERERFCAKCGSPQGEAAPSSASPIRASASASQAPEGPPPLSGSQATTSPPAPAAAATRIKPTLAALLCYVPSVGWIASVVFLSVEPYRNHRYIRFHALQGLFLFAVYLVARLVFAPIPVSIFPFHVFPFRLFALRQIVQLVIVVAQVWGMVETARGCDFRLPILSELAEKSM